MKIIWITWPSAAGKGTVVAYLVEKLGFVHYSVSGYLTEQLQAQGNAINRDTMRGLADSLRAEFWPAYIIEQLYLQAEKNGKNAIIESIRALGEVEILKEKSDFLLLSVNADQKLRYERAIKRNSAKDQITWEHFQQQEALEAENQDPNKWNIVACQKLADIQLDNNGSFEDLYKQIEGLVRFNPL